MKKIYRSLDDKIFLGIFSGLAKYFNVDVVLLRVLAVFVLFFTGGIFLIIYLASCLIIPKSEKYKKWSKDNPFYKRKWFLIVFFLFLVALFSSILYSFVRTSSVDYDYSKIKKSERFEVVSPISLNETHRNLVEDYLNGNVISLNNLEGVIFSEYYLFRKESNRMYVWAYISEYYQENESVVQGQGISVPLILNFNDSFTEIMNHWIPRDGSYYAEDLRLNFPIDISDMAINFQTMNRADLNFLINSVQRKAIDFFELNF